MVSSTSRSSRPYTVCVEGNIGAGKSTFLDRCRAFPVMDVIEEPVSEWMNVGGVNLLVRHQWFYVGRHLIDALRGSII